MHGRFPSGLALSAAALVLLVTPAGAAAGRDYKTVKPPRPVLLEIVNAPCGSDIPGYVATLTEEQQDRLSSCYAGKVYWTPGDGRFILEHEIGHHVDYQHFDDGERNAFQSRFLPRRMRDMPWLGEEGDAALAFAPTPPNEAFADAYAACRMRIDPRHESIDGYGDSYDPTRRLHKRACAFIARAMLD